MPLRSLPSPLGQRFCRLFHAGVILRENHYETLQIPINATPGDVKKSFYKLSKTHHPDRNPNDPFASQRFVKISEAYAVLGAPAKRQQYDRDVIGTQQAASRHVPKGSYYSSGPAGGRPASGLSRRRTQFRGPPPSFYRSGGWGTQGEKRKAAQDNTARGAEAQNQGTGSGTAGGVGGGMGPGQRPWDHGNDVPHFDKEGHFRTHDNYDRRRKRRTSQDYIPVGETRGTLANFLFVGGIISLGVFVPSYLFERFTRKVKAEK